MCTIRNSAHLSHTQYALSATMHTFRTDSVHYPYHSAHLWHRQCAPSAAVRTCPARSSSCSVRSSTEGCEDEGVDEPAPRNQTQETASSVQFVPESGFLHLNLRCSTIPYLSTALPVAPYPASEPHFPYSRSKRVAAYALSVPHFPQQTHSTIRYISSTMRSVSTALARSQYCMSRAPTHIA
eukprot:1467122-Rhodomonas_salina.1